MIGSMLLTGCTLTPQITPDIDEPALPSARVVTPLSLPTLCPMYNEALTQECLQLLVEFVEIAEVNTEIAHLNAKAADKLLISNAQYKQALKEAKQLVQDYVDQLNAQERRHTIKSWLYRLGIVGAFGLGTQIK